MSADFMAIADEIIRRKPQLANCRHTVEKEILHIEILRAMGRAGHLQHLVFKGGTCLRLCRGGIRLSEDLDFSGGPAFDSDMLADIETVLGEHLRHHYGVRTTVRRPQGASGERPVHRWLVRIATRPSPTGSTSNIGVQRVKIEVDTAPPPSGTSVVRANFPHRDVTMPSTGVIVRCVPVSQTLVDKLVALPTSIERRNPRFRDIWDIHEFLPPQASVRRSIIKGARAGALRHMSSRQYEDTLSVASEKLPAIVESEAFQGTLRRFLPADVAEQTIGNRDYRTAMANAMTELFAQISDPHS